VTAATNLRQAKRASNFSRGALTHEASVARGKFKNERPTQMKSKKEILTPEQVELAAEYLAMSNLCTLEPYRKDIKDLSSLKRAVASASNDAVLGGVEGGLPERIAEASVQKEVNSFKRDLKKGGKSAAYWTAQLHKEIPFLFQQ
jgi:hypothetical protein